MRTLSDLYRTAEVPDIQLGGIVPEGRCQWCGDGNIKCPAGAPNFDAPVGSILARIGLILVLTVVFAALLVFGMHMDSDKVLTVTTA